MMQAHIIKNGAGRTDPIAMTSGEGDFIYSRHPGARRLKADDHVWTDFRSTSGGYPADRDRIARGGEPSPAEVRLYQTTRSLTLKLISGIRLARESTSTLPNSCMRSVG